MTIVATVVVPTYLRPALLARCLSALLAQRFDPAAYEIIVADDAASVETAALVERIARQARAQGLTLRYATVTGAHGPAAARNTGWRLAHGAVIAFTDDDCVPDPDWLRMGLGALTEGVAGVSGRLIATCGARPTDYERNAAQLAHAEFVTANMFYRRDALAAIGGFDERFPIAWREDSDLAFTLLERGERIVRAPRAIVAHPQRPAPWGISIRQQQRSMYNALLYRKHPRLYRERIQSAPPWRYYLTVAALLTAVVGGSQRRRGALATGLGAWLILTARFSLMRLRGASRAPSHIAEMLVTSALIPPVCVFWRLAGAIRYRTLFL